MIVIISVSVTLESQHHYLYIQITDILVSYQVHWSKHTKTSDIR